MSVTELIGFAVHVVTKMTANIFFPIPSPSLASVTASATALNTAYDQATGGGPAQTSVMRQKREALETLLIAEAHTVEDIANAPANAATGAEAIILSAGMSVKSFQPRQKRVFAVQLGDMPGTVMLEAEHLVRGSHEWQYSLDVSNLTAWVDVDPSIRATTTIGGLVSLKHYFFRHRSILKDGPTPWEYPIEITVL